VIEKLLFRLVSYLIYNWKSRGNHYLHSPFIFNWYQLIVNEKLLNNDSIQKYRDDLLMDKSDFYYETIESKRIDTSISKRYKQTSIDDKYGEILSHTAHYVGAKNFLELGTSLGVSTLYLALSSEKIQGTTIDYNPNSTNFSKNKFDSLQLHKIKFINGRFEDVLPAYLTSCEPIDLIFIDGNHSYQATIDNTHLIIPKLSSESVIILDDIRWSREMYKAWEELIQLDIFNYTVDFGRIGFLFKTENKSPKQHFILK